MTTSINILDKFNDDVKVKASAAIDELAARGKSQEWIETAFAQKTTEEWEKWGFGLLFRKSFQEQVDKACGKVKESIAAKGPDFSQSPQDDDTTTQSLGTNVISPPFATHSATTSCRKS